LPYLGVDLGAKRIGLALGEPGTGVTSPLAVIEARAAVGDNARAILEVVEDYDVEGIVIGLPLNMDGTEGPQAKLSRALAQAIRRLLKSIQGKGGGAAGTWEVLVRRSIKVYLHDERLTSHAADRRLVDRNLTRKKRKARQDAVAAQILLESFLEDQAPLRTPRTRCRLTPGSPRPPHRS